MGNPQSLYGRLGVDAAKMSVRKAFGSAIDNHFPNAFVNIVRDPFASGVVVTQHSDGDGSKGIQRLLVYLETGDLSVLRGAVDDAVSMNMGDIAASGFLSGLITWTDTLNVGMLTHGSPKKVIMKALAERFGELRKLYEEHGFTVRFLGGETADLPDQVGSQVFDVTVNAREQEENIIRGNVQPGDVIYGFASDGQAAWERQPNSGIMSNGLTLAGTSLGWRGYNEKHRGLRLKNPFTGRYSVDDSDPLIERMTVFEALLSPTRQWAILIHCLVEELKQHDILHMLHGISMNTGGGATKIGHVGTGLLYRKTMPEPPGIFQLIKREGCVSWKEMFQAFNCGVGIDVVGHDDDRFHEALRVVSERTHIALYRLGHTDEHLGGGNKVVLETPYGTFENY